jgi:hypothetical protein
LSFNAGNGEKHCKDGYDLLAEMGENEIIEASDACGKNRYAQGLVLSPVEKTPKCIAPGGYTRFLARLFVC